MKINSIIDLVKDLDTSRQTKNLNKLLIRILLHLQVEFSIAVECKWRSKIGFYLDIKDIEKYERYMNSNLLNRPIKNLFYVFGFGWCGDSPESVYVVPARELYDYDKDTCRITFPIKETEKEKMGRLERFKKKDNRCLLYIK